MSVYGFHGRYPLIHPSAYVFDNVTVIGDVEIGPDVSLWPGVTIRGDKGAVRIGAGANVQDHAMVHSDPDHPVIIGAHVTIAHSAVLHGCTVGDGSVIGIGAIVLNGAVIGEHSRVSAGALVGAGPSYPAASLIAGSPGSVLMSLSKSDIDILVATAGEYRDLAQEYRRHLEVLGTSAAAE